MKILRLDSVGGISGDMMLGVLIGLGADRGKLERCCRPSSRKRHFPLCAKRFA